MYERMVDFLKNRRTDALNRCLKVGGNDPNIRKALDAHIFEFLYDNLNTAIVDHDPRHLSRALEDEARNWLERTESLDPLLSASIILEDVLVQLAHETFSDSEMRFQMAREIIIANLDMARSDTALLLEKLPG